MSNLDKKARSKIMASIRSTNTQPEIMLRRGLAKLGYRYRKNYGKYEYISLSPGRSSPPFAMAAVGITALSMVTSQKAM